MGDVRDRDVVAVGEGVPGVRHRPVTGFEAGRVVLEEDRGQVPPGLAAQPLADQLEVAHPLQDDDVDVLGAQLLGRHLAGRRRPVPGAGPAETVRTAIRDHGQQVLVGALDERRRPGPVHVPEKYLHALTNFSTAATTSAAPTEVRHGWPGTGHSRARVFRQGANWSPSSTVGTP